MAMCFCYLKYNNLRWDVAWNYIIYSHPLPRLAAALGRASAGYLCERFVWGQKTGSGKPGKTDGRRRNKNPVLVFYASIFCILLIYIKKTDLRERIS
ncbi:hypothetical protein ABD07_14595 [Nitrosomonas oligotropha]|nr:hypothetical protein [Nitrosomonas oligotropha]